MTVLSAPVPQENAPQLAGRPVGPVGNPSAAAPQLSPEHLKQLSDARQRARKLRRAATVASFDGWTVGIFGGLTLLCGLFSLVGWIMGGGMIAIAYVELSALPPLRQMTPGICRRLGWNQLALAGLLLGYAAVSLVRTLIGPSPLSETVASAPELSGMLSQYDSLFRLVFVAVYVGLALVAIFAQGGTALYYFTREKHLRDYRAHTPQWILDMQRCGLSL